VIVAVPAVPPPVTILEAGNENEATVILELLQVPPPGSVKVIVVPPQNSPVPGATIAIAAGSGLILTWVVIKHLVALFV
jgi:hypothetical protein